MRILIKNAIVVMPNETAKTHLVLDGGKIVAIGAAPHSVTIDETIDAAGLHLIPGLIDDQVHFREPGLTHKEDLFHAGRACVKGGVTSFLEMPNTKPNATNQDRLNEKLELAAEKSAANYGFYIGATPHNIEDLKSAKRTPGIKIFIGSSTGDLLVDDQSALERIFAETTLPICAHCEDESTVRRNAEALGGGREIADHSKIRNHEAAIVATHRACDLAVRHRHRFHVLHVSAAGELEIIRAARPYVTAEACPHHLLFNVSDYSRLGTLIQMNPALKTAADNAALWAGLLDGTIQVVATDHAPHTLEEKRQPYPKSPSGLPAVENLLPLMLNEVARGRCTLEQVVRWGCENPARVWDIVGKGRIEVGADADLVLVDLNKTAPVRNADQASKCGWSPWDGVELTGWPVRTWVGGETAWAAGDSARGIWNDRLRGKELQFDRGLGGFWAQSK